MDSDYQSIHPVVTPSLSTIYMDIGMSHEKACLLFLLDQHPLYNLRKESIVGHSMSTTQNVPLQRTGDMASDKPHTYAVATTLNYMIDPQDGSAAPPTILGRLETYDRPVASHQVNITDITGHEEEYTLDKNGFEIYPYESRPIDFSNEDAIRNEYYPAMEQLLKDA